MSKKLRRRGPDWSGIFSCDRAIPAHERLAIVGPASWILRKAFEDILHPDIA